MLVIEQDAKEQLHLAFKHAREIGALPNPSGSGDIPAIDQLKDRLRYLDTYAEHDERGRTQCRLWSDSSPHSFYFVMNVRDQDTGEYRRWFNGGLIFHGAHDRGGDGGAPTFSVSLTPASGWSVHT